MSLIEQAGKRLEQLRHAGVELPEEQNLLESSAGTMPHAAVQPAPTVASKDESATAISSEPLIPHTSGGPHVKLDLDAIAASGLLVPNAARNQLSDEFRVVKRPLIANAMGKGATPIPHGNLIMVTSALPGEGKSFSAINLAISIAMELDNTVMLVDADVARPSLLTMLGLPTAEGLLDVLQVNSVDISNVLLRTSIEKLSILPSGTPHPRATELLASETMVRLLDDMSKRYSDRIIIFDSPPLLLTTEARVLATHMGQVVVVVNAENTTQSAVKEAIATIDSCPVKMMLLNQARQTTADTYGYGYSYGYGYGYGYGNEK